SCLSGSRPRSARCWCAEMAAPRVELVVVGDELQSGRVVDTNSAFLGRELAQRGWMPARRVVVGDLETDIRAALEAAAGADLVFVVGGLGPTPDDVTLDAVSRATGRPLVEHGPTLRRIERRFRMSGRRLPALSRRQARVLKGCRLFANPVGAVPGMILNWRGGRLVLLPGVPAELRALLEQRVLAALEQALPTAPLHSVRIRTTGVAEAAIATRSRPILRRFPSVTCGYYPGTAGVDVVLRSGSGRALVQCRSAVEKALGRAVYETGERDLAEVVLDLCRQRGIKLATAESCTGGLIGNLLTDVQGSSACYVGGVVAYANELKRELLGVDEATLAVYGAVSGPVARRMALGCCRALGADLGIAVSGVAGPGGGTKEKPVGLVWTAVAQDGRVRSRAHRFPGPRRAVKQRAAAAALNLARLVLLEPGRPKR
ncbi:CinA family nicotinamide mononucleotide deamidase-related protein, partial [candidate division WOR-3 bacterium]|nr:CinA family nicotinamide mononucleotide deamidase-related protein [candidate division WOR-3 bacterium]